ncbi:MULTISPECIES: phosphate ABC transporter permease PstA [Halococcus]|uniref:Phosphate transport system permease protein PstA n=1 Tax=Halococcus salifodinae DSM 8989 TaxID=1227456 RepID=M0NDI8_9EURY|nr:MULTISPECIES: phosphate ABC transporter permease PstA [Halococcus]EMA55154.1 phosphate ABC transporter permease [Halococcus salifodinae DSM 8989]
MSDAYGTDATLVEGRSSAFERASALAVGLSFLAFLFSWTALFRITPPTSELLGFTLYDLFGVGLVVVGAIVLGLGVASRTDVVTTTPSDTGGIAAATAFGLSALVAAGLLVSQTLGLGVIAWLPAALAAGAVTAVGVVGAREDIAATIPAGILAVGVGLLFLTGIIGPDWVWSPTGFAASFHAPVVVPLLTILCSLLAAWPAAKASAGFGSRGRQTGAYLLIGINTFSILAILVLLIAFVAMQGLPKLTDGFEIGLDGFAWPFITNVSQGIYVDIPGVLPAILGTAWLVVGAVLFAVPLGVGAALFLTEYADEGGFTRIVEIATNGLWSTPSIVFGLFGYAFLVPRFGNTTSLFAGMLVLGFMLLPLVLITSREAIISVPDEYRDASAALGVSQWQTIRSVVLPASVPGIVTGVILGVGRIAGETAPILVVMAGSPFPNSTPNVLGSFAFTTTPPFITNDALLTSASALPYQLYATITAGVGATDVEAFGWGTALVLLLVVLSFYAIGIATRAYFRRKLRYE